MDRMNPPVGTMPTGDPPTSSDGGLGNQGNPSAFNVGEKPPSVDSAAVTSVDNTDTTGQPNSLGGGTAGINGSGMLGNANMSNMGASAGLNAGARNGGLNDLNLAFLMNNAINQQAGGMDGMMNPLLLQAMMNQSMMGNSFGAAGNSNSQMVGMGMNNLIQQGLMSGMGMMGGMGMGVPDLSAMGSMGAASNNAGGPAAPSSKGAAPATSGMDGGNALLLAQLMQNPLAVQMVAQGLNPMAMLGGGMAFAQFGGANPLGALGLGMNGLGASLPGGLNIPAMPNNGAGQGGAAVPHPNALFAFANPASSIGLRPQDSMDGMLKQPDGLTAKSKKLGKKTKVKGKPKRPLSAYNFFFREERARILDSIPKKRKKSEVDEDGEVCDQEEEKAKKEPTEKDPGNDGDDKDESKDEPKDGTKDDEKDYDRVGLDGKKIPHGKIGFENLAKIIGKRWQELDADGVEKYKQLADADMTRYKREMETFLMKEASAGASDGDLGMPPSFYALNRSKAMDEDEQTGPKKKRGKKARQDEITDGINASM